ncbi:MAG: magnesium/cobalt transporter CorA [bacterium]|nr:magnesium/cobalt transporter CorA [bacterium]
MKHIVQIPSFLKTISKKGAAPGTLTHVGLQKVKKTHLGIFRYGKNDCEEKQITKTKDLQEKPNTVLWLNLDGLHDIALIEEIGTRFALHTLLLEDILNTGQRPKIEEYDDCIFIVLKMLHVTGDMQFSLEQVSLVLKDHLVISFHEQPQDVFDPMRERLRKGQGKIRQLGADYLMYRIMDSIIDGYFSGLEHIGDRIEEVEKQLIDKPSDAVIQKIYSLRQQMLFLRKAVHPLRDVANQLQHGECDAIQENTAMYFRDLYDHTIQVIDAVDTYRDILSNMLDNYLSLMSHRMNSVMKVLTIVGTIFIPLTFIAGIYGMNFRYMPELEWAWGYPAVWGVMLTLTLTMLGVMKWKKWL